MRKFTKTHNSLTWLFPIAKTKKEASQVFDYVEENAKELCNSAGIAEKDRDLAIDAFMKGYSYALQLEIGHVREKLIRDIFCNLFKVKCDPDNKAEWKKYFRFYKIEDLFKAFAFGPNKDKEHARKYFCKLFENSAFDNDADPKLGEWKKIL